MSTTAQTADDQHGVQAAQDFAREHPGLVKLGRVGWVAKGVVYLLTGFLAFFIALGSESTITAPTTDGTAATEASQTGAITKLADTAGGTLLLYVMAVGLVLYSAWRIVSAVLPAASDASSWVTRVGYLISAATYLLLAGAAVAIVRNPGDPQKSEDSKVESFTRDLLGHSYGRIVVFLLGAVLIGTAAAFLAKAITASFTSQLAHRGVGPVPYETIVAMGRVGWVGRTAMMGLIGFFLCRAAVRFDADEAQGLDGSLRQAVTSPVGTVLAIVVAVGLLVYGLFCALSAPRRLLVAADR
jgi:hypothetical protein